MLETKSYWERQNPQAIMTGLQMPWEIVEQYLPVVESGFTPPFFRPQVLELGFGGGTLIRTLLGRYGDDFSIHGIDVNPSAVNQLLLLDNDNVKARVGNVRFWECGHGKKGVLHVEKYDVVIMQALTPSLLGRNGEEWKDVIDAIDVWLKPGGIFVFNDFRMGSMYYTPLAKQIGGERAQMIMRVWGKRYEENKRAFPKLGLSRGGFIVGKPGTIGKSLELGDYRDLRRLYEDPQCFERFAQHVDPVEVVRYLGSVRKWQFREDKWEYYQSRNKSELLAPTVMQIWQKPPVYRYEALLRGRNVNTSDQWIDEVMREQAEMMSASMSGGDNYFLEMMITLMENVPDSQKLAVSEVLNEYRAFLNK